MLKAILTPDQGMIQGEVHIAAPPERIFQALTDPRQLLQWWGQKGMYRSTNWKADLRPGGEWRCDGAGDTDGSSYHVSGEFVEVDPPRILSYTWVASWSGTLTTLVRWELEPASGGTLVRLRHGGFAGNAPQAEQHYQGWPLVIGWMQAFVENGDTAATRPPIAPAPRS